MVPTKLITKHSTTIGSVPTTGNLDVGELAINVADKKLYTKDNANNVVLLGDNRVFNNVDTMIADTSILAGEYVSTKGYYNTGKGAATYEIVTSYDYSGTPDEKGAAFTLNTEQDQSSELLQISLEVVVEASGIA